MKNFIKTNWISIVIITILKNGEVGLFDATKDVAKLITDDILFKNYMKDLLK
jgi:hypothetical protein